MKNMYLEEAAKENYLQLLCIYGEDSNDWEKEHGMDHPFRTGNIYSVKELIDFVHNKNGERKMDTVEEYNYEGGEDVVHPDHLTWWVNLEGEYYNHNRDELNPILEPYHLTDERLEWQIEVMCDFGMGDGVSWSPIFFIYIPKEVSYNHLKELIPSFSGADLWLLKELVEEEIKKRLINS